MRLKDVVDAWRVADPKHIHPTREHVSEQAYWDSGKAQAQFVADLFPDRNPVVLDFGCGDGRIAIPMVQLGMIVEAVDAAPEMIDRLKHNMKVQGVSEYGPGYPLIRTHVADGVSPQSRLFRKCGYVDAVNARAVFIHHSHTDVIKMVRNLTACLEPGGFLVADWPIGAHHERRDWIDVSTWDVDHRNKVAEAAGLELVTEGVPTVRPSVWRKQ